MTRLPGLPMRRLAPLVGDWSYVEKSSDPGSLPGSGDAAFISGPGGHSLLFNEVVRAPERSSYAHGILAWRPEIEGYWFLIADSRLPGVQIFAGSWEGEQLVFEGIEGPLSARGYELSDVSPQSFVLQISPAAGGLRRRTYRRKTRAAS